MMHLLYLSQCKGAITGMVMLLSLIEVKYVIANVHRPGHVFILRGIDGVGTAVQFGCQYTLFGNAKFSPLSFSKTWCMFMLARMLLCSVI